MKLQLTLSLVLAAPLALAFLPASAPAATTATEAPTSDASTFSIDAGHSTVLFSCRHLGLSTFYGRFNQLSGEVVYDAKDASACSIQVEVPADSIDSNSEGRDRHLKSGDFLNAAEYPTLRFESTGMKNTGDEVEVTGNLTFHGVTKEVMATAQLVGSGDTPFGDFRLGLEARFEFDMRDFGVEFVKSSPGAVGPMVQIVVSLECVRQ